jgi:hypothetical protein
LAPVADDWFGRCSPNHSACATAGALLGLLIGYLGLRALLVLGASKLPRLDTVTFDTSVFLFTLVILVVTGLLVGFAPALRLARSDVRSLMNESTRSTTGGRGTARWLNVMTVAQIALAILLVAGAGWLVRGFANLRNTDPGLSPTSESFSTSSIAGRNIPTVTLSVRCRAICPIACGRCRA